MHEEATSMSSVPSSVAASTVSVLQQNENGTSTTNAMVNNEEVELEVSQDNENGDLQVPFTTNSEGNHLKKSDKHVKHLQVSSFEFVTLSKPTRSYSINLFIVRTT